MSCFCDIIDLCEKLPGDYFKPMSPQASKRWIYIAAASLTTDVADDKDIYALGLSMCRGQICESRHESETITSPVGSHLSSTNSKTTIRLLIARAMAHEEKGKARMVNCLLDSTDAADELELQGPTSAMTVKVWFRLTPVYPDVAEPLKERTELTALNLLSICDDLIAILTPWFSRDETPPPQLI
ncbi:hypothetical protein T11_10315 [Trichinella zimbabwensis]|uniref:Uncharacterized protein n=1 Tax=Trichinella zimbabwensis TaxID=268475 RepID=A0A0V1HS72_9BILA|nr:hypothetical protein T11_10315 [Trichinella zimbabwensis]